MKNGKFVLENKFGQVVRTFRWDSTALKLVYRHDNRRIEAVGSTKALEAEEISFEVLAEVKREQIKKTPLKLPGLGVLRWKDEVVDIVPAIQLEDENSREYLSVFKWTAAAYFGFLIFVIGLGWVLTPKEAPEQVVKIIDTKTLEEVKKMQKQPARPVVEASDTKPVPPPQKQVQPVAQNSKKIKQPKTQATRSNVKASNKNHRSGGFVGPESGDPNMAGVLGVLGSESKKATGRGGFNAANAKSTGGYGAGKGGGGYGGNGAGGINRGVFGSGMIAANPGSGSSAPGAGGYGRAGRGGGGKTGYGSLNMMGASQAYFSPIEEEAVITGGLDKDAIAEVIQRNMGQIVYCYEQGLQVKPSLAGRVSVRFVINGGGRVSTASIANSSLRHAPAESCIIGKLKSWNFPKPTGGVDVRVTYPFALRRVSSR